MGTKLRRVKLVTGDACSALTGRNFSHQPLRWPRKEVETEEEKEEKLIAAIKSNPALYFKWKDKLHNLEVKSKSRMPLSQMISLRKQIKRIKRILRKCDAERVLNIQAVKQEQQKKTLPFSDVIITYRAEQVNPASLNIEQLKKGITVHRRKIRQINQELYAQPYLGQKIHEQHEQKLKDEQRELKCLEAELQRRETLASTPVVSEPVELVKLQKPIEQVPKDSQIYASQLQRLQEAVQTLESRAVALELSLKEADVSKRVRKPLNIEYMQVCKDRKTAKVALKALMATAAKKK